MDGESLARLFAPPTVKTLRGDAAPYRDLAALYCDNRFDLLGSGWVQVRHHMACRGLEGHRYEMGTAVAADEDGRWLRERINPENLAGSVRIWRLIDGDYLPIDWQLDFKSGYRWSERTWSQDIAYGHLPGVDVKVPWELARMQHLPQLALAYALAHDEGCDGAHILRTARNQILDFAATNPPRFGVNWRCTMDVAIRAANWLVAVDLFRAFGAGFDAAFERVFLDSVYDHGRHIVENLEWNAQARGNHYLADVVGLLFVAAYLPATPETDAWLAFAVQELVAETGLQFTPDGANIEASTNYHRLSAEMVIYATALVSALPSDRLAALETYDHRLLRTRPKLEPAPLPLFDGRGSAGRTPFPPWYFDRLERMAEFAMDVTKPNGRVIQIGDNDSGRFLKLVPTMHALTVKEARETYANLDGFDGLADDAGYWMENHLDHRHLVAAADGLFRRPDFAAFAGDAAVETDIVSALAGGNSSAPLRCEAAAEPARRGDRAVWRRLQRWMNEAPDGSSRTTWIAIPGGNLGSASRLVAYPDFGLYIFRAERVFLSIRCGKLAPKLRGAHAHNDQLAIELAVDGEDWIADPGSYLYTPFPDLRNEYRSVAAHFAPRCFGASFPQRIDRNTRSERKI